VAALGKAILECCGLPGGIPLLAHFLNEQKPAL
jgi:hypothetical protein